MPKSKISTLISSLMSLITFAQVGIYTETPSTTLDIEAQNSTGTSTAVDGLLIPRVDRERERAQSMTGITTSTLVYINDISSGTLSDTAANIDAVGYYYFDGDVWIKLSTGYDDSKANIYNTNGVLTGNRTVTQDAYTLAFTGTEVNSFSVDGSTFSVDASNNRVGIGTSAPDNTLHVSATADPLKLTGLQESSTSSGTLNMDSSGVIYLRNSSSISAVAASGTFTITANNTTIKTNNNGDPTITFDNLGEFSGNTFTATTAGIYSVDYTVGFTQRSTSSDSSDGYMGIIILSLNGTAYLRGESYISPTQSGGAPVLLEAIVPTSVKMAAGDTLTFTLFVFGAVLSSSNTVTGEYNINVTRID